MTFYFLKHFRCEKDYGIFVPANKVVKAGKGYKNILLQQQQQQQRKPNKINTVNFGKV